MFQFARLSLACPWIQQQFVLDYMCYIITYVVYYTCDSYVLVYIKGLNPKRNTMILILSLSYCNMVSDFRNP
ncbi:hypothetical protein QJS04_geneDACA020248 [Acorus gramineus]|uniref:Uncharacterized protein n=1 Tax=Acorus gramineus TaxID=55184 RepID=A0AAV9A490_ACOGR|nr:hypothetical protein QJS04_geneDACA020248 [Acorus gramineus]